MTPSFSLIETQMIRLWDFGWFDVSRFQIGGRFLGGVKSNQILSDFMHDPISQRSFCDQGPWGAPVDRHGPFLRREFLIEWFRPITLEDLHEQIRLTFYDPDFTEPPDARQRRVVMNWIDKIGARGDDIFVLDVPDRADTSVEWSWIWLIYREFASVSSDRAELSIGVIGYD